MPISLPIEIVNHVIEDLGYEGAQGLGLEELWKCTEQVQQDLDPFYKRLIWKWLTNDPRMLVYGGKEEIKGRRASDLNSLEREYGDDLRVVASEDWQWEFLAGGISRVNSPIAGKPFDLLRAISKTRDQGITSMKLAEVTGQDPRSLTGRLNNLESASLIKRVPVTKPQRYYVLVHTRFWDAYRVRNAELITLNSGIEICKNIMKELKIAKNGVRVYADLRDQINLKEKNDKRRFTNSVNRLISKNYVEKLYISQEEGGKRYLALQYLKDLETEDGSDLIGADQEGDEEADETTMDPSLLETSEQSRFPKSYYLNTLFPVQDQILELVKSGGDMGLPAMKLGSLLVGQSGTRYLSRYLLFSSTEKAGKTKNDYLIIRGYDFSGKTKFYRYLTQTNFLRRQQQQIQDTDFILPEVPEPEYTLVDLSASSFDALVPMVDVVQLADGSWWPYWSQYQGSKLVSFASEKVCQKPAPASFKPLQSNPLKISTSSAKLAIRQRKEIKSALVEELPSPPSESAPASTIDSPAVPEEDLTKTDSFTQPTVVGASAGVTRLASTRSGLFAQGKTKSKFESFKSQKRQEILAKLVDRYCVVVTGKALLLELDKLIGSSTVTDKKTLFRDLLSLKDKGRVTLEDGGSTAFTRYVVISTRNKPSGEKLAEAREKAKESNNAHPSAGASEGQQKKPTVDLRKIVLRDISLHAPLPEVQQTPKKPSLPRIPKNTKLKAERKSGAPARMPGPTKKSRAKRKRADQEDGNDNFFGSIITEKKRKVASRPEDETPIKKKRPAGETIRKRNRLSLNVGLESAILILRAIVISQSLSPKGSVDWVQISSSLNIEDMTPDVLRKKWPILRKNFGPEVFRKTHALWKKLLFNNIDSGRVTEEMISSCDIENLLQLWDEVSPETTMSEDKPLYVSKEENDEVYKFKPEMIKRDPYKETTTIANREEQYRNTEFVFSDDKQASTTQNELEVPKAVLKALFATDPAKFDSKKAKQVVSGYGETVCRDALKELEAEHQIVFLGKESQINFELSDKAFGNTESRIDAEFLKTAADFFEVLESAAADRKGLLLSAISPDSTYAPIINLLVEHHVHCTRIDFPISEMFQGYSSRSMVREKLESDFILSNTEPDSEEIAIRAVPVPGGRPCSRLWIDLQGDINAVIWVKCVALVLNQVVFKPGITPTELHKRLYPSMAPFEIGDILDWLEQKNAVAKGDFSAYRAQPRWFKVLSV